MTSRERAELERVVALLMWQDTVEEQAARRAVLASFESVPKAARP